MAGVKGRWSRDSRKRLWQDLQAQSDEDFLEGLRREDREVALLDLSAYDSALVRASEKAERLLAEAQEAARLRAEAAQVLRRPRPAGDERLLKRFGGRALVEALLERSFEARYSDPKAMLDYAERAYGVVLGLAPSTYSPEVFADLWLRTLAELANAYRVNNLLGDAEDTLEEAKGWLSQASGNPEMLARVLDVEASLLIEQRQLQPAGELLERAHAIYQEIGETHLAGRTIVSRARVAYTGGDARTAVRLLEDGLSLLDRERDSKLVSTCNQALLGYLVESGEYHRAAALLLESGLPQAFSGEPLNALRLRWVESKIHAGLGRLSRAEAILEEVRSGFASRDLHYDAALAGLDLAALALRQGRPDRVKELTDEILATVGRLGLPAVEASNALTLLQASYRRGVLNEQFILTTKDFLVRLRRDRTLKLDLGATIERCLR
jgi:hypothetical protein